MTRNEEYVLNTLALSVGGVVTDGEDPPDGYISIDGKRIAVEVSRLVESVSSDEEGSRSRLSDDIPALTMADQIEDAIGEKLPKGVTALLIVAAPVNNIRMTRLDVQKRVLEMVESGTNENEESIFGNKISINIYTGNRQSHRRISIAVANRYSSSNISENVEKMLKERISFKTIRRNTAADAEEYWLALYNEYWIAEFDSYRAAYRKLNIEHDFDQIFVVDAYQHAKPLISSE